jgi:hypothetical protein
MDCHDREQAKHKQVRPQQHEARRVRGLKAAQARPLTKLEHEARTAKRGLWSLPKNEIVAPWEWRRRKSLEMFADYSRETTAKCVAAIGEG